VLISDCIEFAAAKHPDDPALIFDGITTTFAALRSRCRRLANSLSAVARPGDRIAILSENRPEYVEAIYGVPRAAMSLCLLNYRLNPREIVRIVNDAEPSVLLTEPAYLPVYEAIRAEIPSVATVIVAGGEAPPGTIAYERLLAAASDEEPRAEVDEKALAWLIYTSGTTGLPKGAMLSHGNVLAANNSVALKWHNHGGRTLLAPWPMCHVAAEIFPLSHLLGWCVVLMRSFDPVSYLENIDRHRCTTALGAPTMLGMLLQHPRLDDFDLSSLKIISYGSAPMPGEVLRLAMDVLPNVGWETNYGMTELAGSVCYLTAADHRAALAHDPAVLKSVGRQLPLSVCRVVDDEMNDVPRGAPGEVVARGPQVMLGYWRRPEANAEAFRGGWFHTGDIATVDDEGRFYIVDRKKDMIITGGENVYSREVEEILYTHPAVAEAAVVGIPDPTWGEQVVAVIQLHPGSSADPAGLVAAELIALCRENLAGYKKPKKVVFVEELPHTANGKIAKRQLRDQISAGRREDDLSAGAAAKGAGRSEAGRSGAGHGGT
jgi:acyl-CoA synthetase (AMP-forming)/AMP-acid ligase II